MSRLAVLAVALIIAGCAGTPPSRYYQMDAGPPPAAAVTDGPVVFVDRAVVAGYADRSPIVVRQGVAEVAFAEFDVWAEPVAAQVTAVVVDALGHRLGPAKVIPTPARRDREPAFRVGVEVLRFEIGTDNRALLDARWTLLEGPAERFVAAGRERLTATPADPASFDAKAAALAQTLVQLADAIADAIAAPRP